MRIFAHDFVGDKEKIRRHTFVWQGFLTQSAAKSAEKTYGKRCETDSHTFVSSPGNKKVPSAQQSCSLCKRDEGTLRGTTLFDASLHPLTHIWQCAAPITEGSPAEPTDTFVRSVCGSGRSYHERLSTASHRPAALCGKTRPLFSLQRLFFTKQICIFETTPHLPHLRLQAGLLISYYTAPLSICQVDFQNFFRFLRHRIKSALILQYFE